MKCGELLIVMYYNNMKLTAFNSHFTAIIESTALLITDLFERHFLSVCMFDQMDIIRWMNLTFLNYYYFLIDEKQ